MIRFATIGTSSITRRFAAACSQLPQVELVAAHSRSRDSAEAFARDLGMAWATDDITELLAAPDVDAVYIATPNSVHAEQARAALQAGKHVFCEKPATATAGEFEELADLANGSRLTLLENMRPAFDPGMAEIAALVPSLGRLRRASLHYCQRSSRYDQVLAGEQVNIFDPSLAGGALMDLGVYCIAPMVQLFGEPERVEAIQIEVGSGADGAGSALAGYPGFVVSLGWSKITLSSAPSEIQGELGTLTIDHIADLPRLRVDYLDGNAREIVPDKAADNMVYGVQRFAELVGAKEPATAENLRTLGTLRVVERIREAAARAA